MRWKSAATFTMKKWISSMSCRRKAKRCCLDLQRIWAWNDSPAMPKLWNNYLNWGKPIAKHARRNCSASWARPERIKLRKFLVGRIGNFFCLVNLSIQNKKFIHAYVRSGAVLFIKAALRSSFSLTMAISWLILWKQYSCKKMNKKQRRLTAITFSSKIVK